MAYTKELASPNLQAFLRLIRAGESSQGPEAYRTVVGGGQVDSLVDHPRQRIYIQSLGVWSTAAGAYQFLSRTWDECASALQLRDFSPASQDQAAVFLIQRRGALADALAGRIEQAIGKCRNEWASLPGSPYGQPTRTVAQALATYRQFGGQLEGAAVQTPALASTAASTPASTAAPTPTPTPTAAAAAPAAATPPLPTITTTITQEDPAMLPILIPSLIDAGSEIIGALGRNLINAFTPLAAEKVQKEISRHTNNPDIAAQVTAAIVQAAQAATGKTDPIEAVAAAHKDPAAMAQVEQTTLQRLEQMAPLLKTIDDINRTRFADEEGSRNAAADRATRDTMKDDMGKMLVLGAMGAMLLLFTTALVIMVIETWKTGEASVQAWTLLSGIAGTTTTIVVSLYAYRFGASRSDATNQAVIAQIAKAP